MTALNSKAETFAESATSLPEFRNVNLGGIKDQVAEILNLIGRVEGIFSTYTKHDISHINTMLGMLDWIVPPSTLRVMSPVDWLITVLAIYLHDLGMVVTSEEFLERMNNQEFVKFLERIDRDPEAKDYRARAEAMTDDERPRFFYQEFVRLHHASRIREWITGRHSRRWGDAVAPISMTIAELMEKLPSRFRENLAIACESHHKNNLDRLDIYPLAQRYGNHPQEIANVQYSAILLRTVDLIHVTKDRTPSVMYRTIRFSDLKSVDEWDKQRGAFSVHIRGREFDPADLDSHIIDVSADFTEERPFFALTEYLSWADSEIRQSKQWADSSQLKSDAKEFWFPWRGIKGDIRVEGNLPRQMRFELDRGRLLDLLVGHTIYNEPTVAIRELLQNAIDAVRYQYYLDQKQAATGELTNAQIGNVVVRWNPINRELVVQDTGIGMDLNAIQNHLLRVGASFYDTPQFQSENEDFSPISRFGIGILTCFMISDNIEIITFRAGEGRRIRMSSVHADYLLKELQAGAPELDGLEPHGTAVRLVLRPSVDLEKKSVVDIVRQWVIMPACEVLYSEPGDKEQSVGAKDIADAVRNLFFGRGRRESQDDSYEVVSVTPESNDGAVYEIAFLVQRSMFPERSFVILSKDEQEQGRSAAVCIEGIRADSHLPGFRNDLCAVLSVRNNKGFRTTVSRESLETDDEYMKVATICADALFSHVRNEVERISNLEGRPLSQASTAGRIVFRPLLRACDLWRTYDRIDSLYDGLPLVVVERSSMSAAGLSESRELRSLREISQLNEFWTIESRTVDYLGVISRDLGRELNISSFLGRLAPELYEAAINPIVVGAEVFAEKLSHSNSVVEVNFSRKHQRTLLRWIGLQQQADPSQLEFESIDVDEFDQVATKIELDLSEIGLYIKNIGSRLVKERVAKKINRVIIREIKGDVEEVHGVRTRIVTVLRPHTEIANGWASLSSAWRTSDLSTRERAVLLMGLLLFASGAGEQRGNKYVTRRMHRRRILHPWRALSTELNELLEKIGLDAALPSESDELFGPGSRWFDASNFWRDWTELDEDV